MTMIRTSLVLSLIGFAMLLPQPSFAKKNVAVCVQVTEHVSAVPEKKEPVELSANGSTVEPSSNDEPSVNSTTSKADRTVKAADGEKETGDASGTTDKTVDSQKTNATPASGAAASVLPPEPAASSDLPWSQADGATPAQNATSQTPVLPASGAAEQLRTEQQVAKLRAKVQILKARLNNMDQVDALPKGQTVLQYLTRLLEHYVTHEPGFTSTTGKCAQTISVDLYPLRRGWTVFARYTGTNREEKVDQLFENELSSFSERAVLALLHDVPIAATLNRENVLKDDSMARVQRVRGSNHFTLNVGTRLVGGLVDQVQEDKGPDAPVKEEFTLFHPMEFGLGYRGRFEAWGLEVQAHLGLGVGRKAATSNTQGGHIDYGGNAGTGIHFLRYHDPRALTTIYGGGGATFDYVWFSVINPRYADNVRSPLHSGGLTADGVFGWEFLRAATVQFYIQAEVNLPVYVSRGETNSGRIDSWMPGVTLKLGVVF